MSWLRSIQRASRNYTPIVYNFPSRWMSGTSKPVNNKEDTDTRKEVEESTEKKSSSFFSSLVTEFKKEYKDDIEQLRNKVANASDTAPNGSPSPIAAQPSNAPKTEQSVEQRDGDMEEEETTPKPRRTLGRRTLTGRSRSRGPTTPDAGALTVVAAPEPSEPAPSGILSLFRNPFSKKDSDKKPDSEVTPYAQGGAPYRDTDNGHTTLVRGDTPTPPWNTKKSFFGRAFAQRSHPATFPEEYYWYKFSDGNYLASWRPLGEFDLNPQNDVSAAVLYNARYLDNQPNCGLVDDTTPEQSPMRHPDRYHYYQYPDGSYVAAKEPLQ